MVSNKIVVIDVETTGLWEDGSEPPRIVEVAAVRVDRARPGSSWRVDQRPFSTLVNPGVPIPVTARAVHHISDDDVGDAPSIKEVVGRMLKIDGLVRAAHNAEYDSKFFDGIVVDAADWICTLRCSKHVWPDAPGYGNQVLRYWLGLDILMRENHGTSAALSLPPHRALPDAWVTAHLLVVLLNTGRTPDDLQELTLKPILLGKVHFGKHVGTPWADVPPDYLKWILRGEENVPGSWDPDVIHTAWTYYKGAR